MNINSQNNSRFTLNYMNKHQSKLSPVGRTKPIEDGEYVPVDKWKYMCSVSHSNFWISLGEEPIP